MESLGITDEDMGRWREQGRSDILAQVGQYMSWKSRGPCPFAHEIGDDRYTCAIYDTRPHTCREYPVAVIHMTFVDCEMLEPGDTDADVARFMGRDVKGQGAKRT
jgi:Fe-S-cluster containining protein